MVVISDCNNQSFVSRNSFDIIAPFPRHLDSKVNRLRARIHWERQVVSKQLTDFSAEYRIMFIVICSRSNGQALALLYHHLCDSGMTVPLVHHGEGAQKVNVFLAFNIPKICTLASGKHNWK